MLIAAFCGWHEHHSMAAAVFQTAAARRQPLVLAAPVLLETYAVLTRLPPPHRLSPASARALIDGNLTRLRTIALDARGYWLLVREAAEMNVAGGRSYDALVVACAVRARADAVITFNERDFAGLMPSGMGLEVPGR